MHHNDPIAMRTTVKQNGGRVDISEWEAGKGVLCEQNEDGRGEKGGEKSAEASIGEMTRHKHIHISKYPDADRDNYWISFESDPRLTKTKKNIYGKCLPCIQNLYHQLQDRKTEIILNTAFDCWKITAVFGSIDECLDLLQRFEQDFLSGHVYGKYGKR